MPGNFKRFLRRFHPFSACPMGRLKGCAVRSPLFFCPVRFMIPSNKFFPVGTGPAGPPLPVRREFQPSKLSAGQGGGMDDGYAAQQRDPDARFLPAVPLRHRHPGSGDPGLYRLSEGRGTVLVADPAGGPHRLRRLPLPELFRLRRKSLSHRSGPPAAGRPADPAGD